VTMVRAVTSSAAQYRTCLDSLGRRTRVLRRNSFIGAGLEAHSFLA
jgi:hypothetical protein